MPKEQFDPLYHAQWEDYRNERETVLANRDMRMFFNAPGSEPRYEVWGKLAYWTVDEATALSLGKDPQIVNERSMAPSKAKPGREFPPSAEFLDNSPFFHLYLQRRDMISRAHSYGVFGTHITPNSFLNWAQARHLSCPEQLLSVAGFESEPAVLSAEHEAALARISDLTGQLSEISAALVELRTSVDEIKPRRQVTLYKMILAMAVKHYQFGTRIGGRGTTSAIVSSADRVGYPVSTDAVHDVLESVRERLGFVQK
ncbi:MAG: hypothetical protein BGO83_18600 [Devosia sp. 66-14]|nr:MAG: hypothetical protein ABS47_10555 [Devosia sp. SCN 66-27]OJX22787.1 MAG: hypothetical protein BGO83_18600 [Devosia sp. 66-14]